MSDVERRTTADLDPDDVVMITRSGVRKIGARKFHTGECQSIQRAERVQEVTKTDLETRLGSFVECANSKCGDTKPSGDHTRTGTIELLESLDPDDVFGGETA